MKDAQRPSPSNGTSIAIPVLTDSSTPIPAGGWWARLVETGNLAVKVQVIYMSAGELSLRAL